MQFQIACKHCKQHFGIDVLPGQTVRCNCPYCGQEAIIATPESWQPAPEPTVATKQSRGWVDWHFGRKITLIFLALMALLFVTCGVLYAVFSAMSN